MKLTMARHGLRLFTATVLFGAWLFSVSSAGAQELSNQYRNWKTEPEATLKLESEITQLMTTMNGQTPGTPAFETTESQMTYYKMILNFISQGKSVAEAIELALPYADTSWLGPDSSPAVDAHRTQLYNDALGALTN